MFTKDQFKASLVQLFGSKEEKAAQLRAALEGSFAFAWYHAARHGNAAPFQQLGEAVAKGGGLKGAVRTVLGTVNVPRKTEAPDDTLKTNAAEFATRAMLMLEEAEKMQVEKRAEAKSKRDAEKAEVEALRAEKAQREAPVTVIADVPCLIGPDNVPVSLTDAEYKELAEYLALMRATEVKSDEPETLKVAA